MARKKKSQTDKSDATESAAEPVTGTPVDPAGTPDTAPDTAPGTPQEADDTPERPQDDPAAEQTAERAGDGSDTADDQDPDATNAAEAQEPQDEPTGADTTPDADPESGTVPSAEEPAAPAQDEAASGPWHAAAQTGTQETTPPDDAEPRQEADTPPETEAAPAPEPTPVVRTEQVTVRKGGFWSMLLGGVAAAGIGVAAAPYIHPYLPTAEAPEPADDGLGARLDAQAQRISDLGARIDGLPTPTDRSGEIDGLSETVTSLAERVADLEVRLSTLADRPAPQAPDTAATDAEMDALRENLAAQSLEIESLRAAIEADEQAARDSARATLQRAALTRVMTALDTGEDYSAALTDLRDTGAEVPEALSGPAETGVPTRAQLVGGFPEAARAALAAARAAETDGGASVGAFLRAQLGVRSLEPREGDDADAILSRAEAALAEGRLGDALAEIETLPEGARAAMSGWAAEATARRDALAAAEALSAELN